MTEPDAEREYLEKKQLAKNRAYYICRNGWSLFREFVFFTLAVSRATPQLIVNFRDYVEYLVDPKRELDFAFELLLRKLSEFNYKLRFVEEEIETNRYEPVALIYFNKYYWVKVSFFHVFSYFFSYVITL